MSPKKRIPKLRIEGAVLKWRNFAGKETRYTPAGKRFFSVVLDEDIAKKLKEDGWNIKWKIPKNPDDDSIAILEVEVKFGEYPPKIVEITERGKTTLTENKISILDYAEFANVDLIITPYVWEVNGRGGVKAYLDTMYFEIIQDEFAEKYKDLPETDNVD